MLMLSASLSYLSTEQLLGNSLVSYSLALMLWRMHTDFAQKLLGFIAEREPFWFVYIMV